MTPIGAQDGITLSDRVRITIRNNAGPTTPFNVIRLDGGFSNGFMLENHFYPGIDYYNGGRYQYSQIELNYVTRHPEYLLANPRRDEFESIAHYLQGMIYLYHADGLGRRNVAREHFEQAITYNPLNYMAYIELSRVYGELRVPAHAIAILQRLMELNPPENIVAQAKTELQKLSPQDQNKSDAKSQSPVPPSEQSTR
jgi:tetratricopeptide (TPR) repeat protein